MSRSSKKSKISSFSSSKSERLDKKYWHSAIRVRQREIIKKSIRDRTLDVEHVDKNSIMSKNQMSKDGKHYLNSECISLPSFREPGSIFCTQKEQLKERLRMKKLMRK